MTTQFEIDGSSYFLAGTRFGELISANGGKIDNNNEALFVQLQKEIKEETFGVFELNEEHGEYFLKCNYTNTIHSMTIDKAHIANDYQWGGFVYLTFTVNVKGFTKEMLKEIADYMNPTAKFWHNFYEKLNKLTPPRGQNFDEHWQNEAELREEIINALIANCNKQENLLIEPKFIFGGETNEQAIRNCFSSIQTANDFFTVRNSKIGNYSERPQYFVISKNAMIKAANDKMPIRNIEGEKVADDFFDTLHVQATMIAQANRVEQSEVKISMATL